ncbi:HesB/IscA family protein [Paenibacillus provencensis]|uniref:HesB/IscA family protein n=1 Tax=Paenibacillus provencensis TaxID=441151 RepID=A0ABW3PNS3_9BACL|nr:iron-sulfur cluster assembly accessory protein [Paenibacillus sp. MER 78]MCM3127168.1 iron-sulfur cluster assembly accessory protein [Paenibacillus sp. MER 78]
MIYVSDVASEKINEILQENIPNAYLRVGVDEGGCSGLSYSLIVDDQQREGDIVVNQGDFNILINSDSLMYIEDLQIDYEESGMIGGFTLNNPNARATCGCGASFRIANYRGKAKKCD